VFTSLTTRSRNYNLVLDLILISDPSLKRREGRVEELKSGWGMDEGKNGRDEAIAKYCLSGNASPASVRRTKTKIDCKEIHPQIKRTQ